MHPILFELGDFPVHTYGLMGMLGFLLVVFVLLRRARQLFLNLDKVVDTIFWTALSGLIGARGLYLLQNPEAVQTLGQVFQIRQGGLVFYGALLLGLPVAALLVWRHGLPLRAFLDALATALPLGHGVSRLGCFFAGCCYGRPTELPWGIVHHHPLADAPAGLSLHPVQLYEAAALIGIGVVLNLLYAKKRFDGQILLLYLALYAGARLLVETFRGDASRGFLLGEWLSFSQGVSLLVGLLAVGGLVLARWRQGAQTG